MTAFHASSFHESVMISVQVGAVTSRFLQTSKANDGASAVPVLLGWLDSACNRVCDQWSCGTAGAIGSCIDPNLEGLVHREWMSHLQPAGVHGAPGATTAIPLQPGSEGRHKVIRLPWHMIHLQGHSIRLLVVSDHTPVCGQWQQIRAQRCLSVDKHKAGCAGFGMRCPHWQAFRHFLHLILETQTLVH